MLKRIGLVLIASSALTLQACSNEKPDPTVSSTEDVTEVAFVSDGQNEDAATNENHLVPSMSEEQLYGCMKAFVGIEKIYPNLFGEPMIAGFMKTLRTPNLSALIASKLAERGQRDKIQGIYSKRLKEFDSLLAYPNGMKSALMEDTKIIFKCDDFYTPEASID